MTASETDHIRAAVPREGSRRSIKLCVRTSFKQAL
jgi:hypothetical protein